jgi:Glyoxalase-like domain
VVVGEGSAAFGLCRAIPDRSATDDRPTVTEPGPRCWHVVPEPKAVKNRLHLDISVSGGRAVPMETRRQRVDAEAERLAGLGASFVRVPSEEGLDHYAIAMQDPGGNEFDIN